MEALHKQSIEIDKIAPALVKALARITDVGKSETATVKSERTGKEFQYKYATLSGVLGIIRPIFAENELTLMQFTRGNAEGTRVDVETMALHSSGQWISDSLMIPFEGVGARGAGSAITYARRYGAMAFVGMASDDDDAAAAQKAEESSQQRMWDGQVADYIAAIDGADSKDEAKGYYNDAVAKCRQRQDVGAANRVKAALLKRYPATA